MGRYDINLDMQGCSSENSLAVKIFIKPVNIFRKRPGTKLCPHSTATPQMQGYQALRLKDCRHSTRKENTLYVLKTRFYSNYF